MNIESAKITLRALTSNDKELLINMLNNSEIESFVIGWSFPTSEEKQDEWFKEQILDKKNMRLIIEDKNTNESLGITGLWDIDWKNRCAVTGIKLYNKLVMNKGIGTEAINLILEYAFNELNLNRIEAIILDYNYASKKLFINKCGFKEEGILRERVFKKGKYHDVHLVSKLKDDK